jgi:uncharacterized phiE125 gp8 family phage protein
MTNRLITPPVALAVSLAAARANLREPDVALNGIIETWIKGITAHAEHYMGRAIISQGWRVTLDTFPDAIRLDRPPIVSVASVKYYDAAGLLQTLDLQDYTVDLVSEPGYVVPARGKSWPATDDRINAVMVDYTCGYGADDTTTPEDIRLYILAKLTEQFTAEPGKEVKSCFLDRLLDGKVIWG